MMTTKQIAEAVGKDITTVQRWVKKTGGKMQSIDRKMQSSTSTHPADYDREGLLETATSIAVELVA
jgi:beta-lactamase class A